MDHSNIDTLGPTTASTSVLIIKVSDFPGQLMHLNNSVHGLAIQVSSSSSVCLIAQYF